MMSDISTRLHKCILESGHSYGELAKLTGIPKSAIQRYATGETTKIPMDRLQALASVLHISAQYLMGWEEETKKEPQQPDLLVNGDPELTEILTKARDNPRLRMLFSLTKDATAEDVEAAIKIIEALKSRG